MRAERIVGSRSSSDQPLAWRDGARRWRACVVLAAVAVATAALGSAAWWHAAGETAHARLRLDGERASDAQNEAVPLAPPTPTDFTHALPRHPDGEAALAYLERKCAESAVELRSVDMRQKAATREDLARSELGVDLRGSYAAVKRVLADTLANHSNMTVRRLRLQRHEADAGSAGGVEASVVLVLWGRSIEDGSAQAVNAR